MASGSSLRLKRPVAGRASKANPSANMLQEVRVVPESGTKSRSKSVSDSSYEMLRCDECLSPCSPNVECHRTEEFGVEYDDLPELQEARESRTVSAAFPLDSGVSHCEIVTTASEIAHCFIARSSSSLSQGMHPSVTITECFVNNASGPCLAKAVHGPDSVAQPCGSGGSGTNWLTELANIATGPQSPLLQSTSMCRSQPVSHVSSQNLHSYARPPPLTLHHLSTPARRHSVKMEQSGEDPEPGLISISPRSSISDDDELGWSHTWPTTAWHCFLKETKVIFHVGPKAEWQSVEEVARQEEAGRLNGKPHCQRAGRAKLILNYGVDGLTLISREEFISSGQSLMRLSFDPGKHDQPKLTADCFLDHPFFVKKKGWASFHPSLTVIKYGIPCSDMEVRDVCLPPDHPLAQSSADSGVFDAFKSFDFTPMDSSAVYVLSSMARQRCASLGGHSSGSGAAAGATAPATPNTPMRNKRPMNAFMLFAKRFRVEYTKMYPGKDNRAVSVMLGERWKRMKPEEKLVYELEAKALADEQKHLNPDCWKRKRTNSTSHQER
ncbi:HMG box-containing protein 1 isoform X2 [Lethenteron reissneri]|uniref:HMG box-containing protein 1 isoform X2 n=1 Tax=Lethenteron reissneri TaxID=7753 RepID=UPI002AB70B6D|nr:HMG box-containing protein 1 isoform X2 [Lethenteron reissneri]